MHFVSTFSHIIFMFRILFWFLALSCRESQKNRSKIILKLLKAVSPHSPDIGQNLDGGISNLLISGQSLIKENCHYSRTR